MAKNKSNVTIGRGADAIAKAAEASSRSGASKDALPWFSPKPGKTYVLRFLTRMDDIISVKMHRIWMKQAVNGRNLVQFTCYGDNKCPGCMYGDKPKYRGYALVYDQGAGRDDPKVLIWGAGIRVMEAVYALYEKYKDITRFTVDVKRKGEGLDTEYTLLPNPASKPDSDELKAINKPPFDIEELASPPENRREIYDLLFAGKDDSDDDDEDEEEDDTYEDDEEEDQDDTHDEDEEEDERPAHKTKKKKVTGKKARR